MEKADTLFHCFARNWPLSDVINGTLFISYKKTSLGQNSLHAYLFILFADSKVLGLVPGLVIDSRKNTVILKIFRSYQTIFLMLLFDPVCWDQIRSATQD